MLWFQLPHMISFFPLSRYWSTWDQKSSQKACITPFVVFSCRREHFLLCIHFFIAIGLKSCWNISNLNTYYSCGWVVFPSEWHRAPSSHVVLIFGTFLYFQWKISSRDDTNTSRLMSCFCFKTKYYEP